MREGYESIEKKIKNPLTNKTTSAIINIEDEGGNRRTPTKGMCVTRSPSSSPLSQKDF